MSSQISSQISSASSPSEFMSGEEELSDEKNAEVTLDQTLQDMPTPSEAMSLPPLSRQLSRFDLPGYTLELSYVPGEDNEEDELFQHSLFWPTLAGGYSSLPLITGREISMLCLMDCFLSRRNWDTDVLDDDIASAWKVAFLSKQGYGRTPKMMEWFIQELRYKAKVFRRTGAIAIWNGDVVMSDVVVPESLRLALRRAVAPLENVRSKNYRPGSRGRVVDLVHPSYYPLIYGRTHILPDRLLSLENCLNHCGEGVLTKPPDQVVRCPDGHQYSIRFQWLPCEVDWSGPDKSLKITSYVNNLHPQQHTDMYIVLAEVIKRAIPLWNITLSALKGGKFKKRIEYDNVEYSPDPDKLPSEQRPTPGPFELPEDFGRRYFKWDSDNRKVVQPEPGTFEAPTTTRDEADNPVDQSKRQEHTKNNTTDFAGSVELKSDMPTELVDLERDYRDRGLQIVVELDNIELTPESPSYNVNARWHGSGQMNEHICASAYYFYDTSNILDSTLYFRQQSDHDLSKIDHIPGRDDWLRAVFGLRWGDPAVQDVPGVSCTEGRLVSVPNILQHRISTVHLTDQTMPGHMKMLVLHLVDPHIRIISTANVAPQQHEWWKDAVLNGPLVEGLFAAQPAEMRNLVLESVDGEFPIGREEAEMFARDMEIERKVFVAYINQAFENMRFKV